MYLFRVKTLRNAQFYISNTKKVKELIKKENKSQKLNATDYNLLIAQDL